MRKLQLFHKHYLQSIIPIVLCFLFSFLHSFRIHCPEIQTYVKGKNYLLGVDNYSDNFYFYMNVQLGHLRQLQFFQPTDRQTDILIENTFRSLKMSITKVTKL